MATWPHKKCPPKFKGRVDGKNLSQNNELTRKEDKESKNDKGERYNKKQSMHKIGQEKRGTKRGKQNKTKENRSWHWRIKGGVHQAIPPPPPPPPPSVPIRPCF